MKCDRCQKEMKSFTMSRMNTDHLCSECLDAEKNHPKYQEAHDIELAEVKKGNYQYPGLFAGQKWPFEPNDTK